jgi:PAS domain S-box-containing protein
MILEKISPIHRNANTDTEFHRHLKKLLPESKDDEYERFFELSADMLCIAGFDGFFKNVNPSFERVLGYTTEELLSRPFMDFVIQEEFAGTANELLRINAGHSPSTFENRYRCKDGSIKWLSWRSFALHEEKVIYSVARDITEEKQTQFLLKQQTEFLKELITSKNDGLEYARLLQEALFHDPATLSLIFPDSFIYHSSKDILSGDFYWFERVGNKAFVSCADCTGHGVSGALLSVLGVNKLHEIVASLEFPPSKILDKLNTVVCRALGKKYSAKKMNDGMDIALFAVDLETRRLDFSGANNPLCIVRNGELIELKADKQGIGLLNNKPFTNTTYQLESGDMLYIFSDGYADQFGGEKGKKFTRRQFKNLLVSIADKNTDAQKENLHSALQQWMQGLEQTDDICVIGIRVQ